MVKQADLVLAMQLRPDAFTPEQKARNFAYYEALTVRDSSLSAATQAVLAAEVGHLELAHDYLAESVLIDLADTEQNVRDGLHLAALAGGWTATVAGLGGLRVGAGPLTFAPRLPAAISRLTFSLCIRSQQLQVQITHGGATYLLAAGQPATISHHGETVTLQAGEPLTLAIPPAPQVAPVRQPHGREPVSRAERRG